MPMPLSGAASPSLSASNTAPASPPGLSVLITLADRSDGLDQAPEGAEQAEEDQQPGHVARHVARLVEAGGDRIENAAHHGRGDRHAPHAVAEQGGHRRQQHRRALDREARVGEAETVHPVDFRKQPDDLPEGQQDADEQNAEDQGIKAGIGEERRPDLLVEHDDDERAQDQEHHHPDEKNPGRRKLERVEFLRHRAEHRV